MPSTVDREWLRCAEACKILNWPTSRLYKFALMCEIRHFAPAGSAIRFSRSDVERLAGVARKATAKRKGQ